MKTTLTILLSLTLTFLSYSQEEEENYVQFGFGVSLSSELNVYNFYGGYEGSLIETLPINMANISIVIKDNYFRVEPCLGYFTNSSDYSNGVSFTERSTTNIRIGTLIAFNDVHFESMNLYYGVDIGLILSNNSYTSSYSDQSTNDSKTDFFVGPAVGGEYLFIKYFSLGGEINLNYISIGHYDSEGESSSWAISTRGIIYLRWYLN